MQTKRTFLKSFLGAFMTVAMGTFLSAPVAAQTPPKSGMITGYDIQNAVVSGFGGWSHYYTGRIKKVKSIDFRNIDVVDNLGTLANYSRGQGTLNDGLIALDNQATQLFAIEETDGTPIRVSITVYFDKPYRLSSLSLYAYPYYGNNQRNNLTGLTVTAGTVSHPFATTLVGANLETAYVDFAGSPITAQYVDRVTLSGFTTDAVNDPNGRYFFGISEMAFTTVDASAAQ